MVGYEYVTNRDITSLVQYSVQSGKMSPISDEEIRSLTSTINAIMKQRNMVEKIPYGRDNYRDIVDEIFVALTE